MAKKINLDEIKFDGYMPSPPDDRDYTAETVCLMAQESFPEEYRTEGNIPVLNQGVNSDCVAHSLAVATAYGQYKVDGNYNDLSRGYIYGNRSATDYQGEGMYIRQALKHLNHEGDCFNQTFPWRGSYSQMKAKIEQDAEKYVQEAAPQAIANYFRLYTEAEIKRALMAQGSVVLGVTVYSSFSTHIPLPTKDDTRRGGHAMCCVGWNREGWILQNSWGKSSGDKGFYYLPYDYPVDEWWGITATPATPNPKKDSIFKRIAAWIVNLWNQIKVIFSKK